MTSPVTPSEPSTARRRPRPVFFAVGLVLAAALAVGLFSGIGTGSGGGRPHAGTQVPSFSLPAVGSKGRAGIPADGGSDGHPVVIVFFASWCSACKTEVPALAATYRSEQADHSRLTRVRLLGVDGSDPTSDAEAFLRSSGVTFPVAADRTYAVTQGLFEFTELPEAVIVDGDGTIAAVHLGALGTGQLVSWQRKLLAG